MRSRLYWALTPLFLVVMFAATPSIALALDDPHHPDDGTAVASPGEAQRSPSMAAEDEAAVFGGTPAPGKVAACLGAMPMMGMMMGSPEDNRSVAMPMMQMMQGMAGMQMMQSMQMMQATELEMMRTMQSMQQQMMRMQQMLGNQRSTMEQMP